MRKKLLLVLVPIVIVIIGFFIITNLFDNSPSKVVNTFLKSLVKWKLASDQLILEDDLENPNSFRPNLNELKEYKISKELISGDMAVVFFVLYYNDNKESRHSAGLINSGGWKISKISNIMEDKPKTIP